MTLFMAEKTSIMRTTLSLHVHLLTTGLVGMLHFFMVLGLTERLLQHAKEWQRAKLYRQVHLNHLRHQRFSHDPERGTLRTQSLLHTHLPSGNASRFKAERSGFNLHICSIQNQMQFALWMIKKISWVLNYSPLPFNSWAGPNLCIMYVTIFSFSTTWVFKVSL